MEDVAVVPRSTNRRIHDAPLPPPTNYWVEAFRLAVDTHQRDSFGVGEAAAEIKATMVIQTAKRFFNYIAPAIAKRADLDGPTPH